MSTTEGSSQHNTGNRTPMIARLAGVILVSLALVAASVLPQLTARLTGDEYQLRVAPLDPIDPFRGAYVALAYPDLQPMDEEGFPTDPVDDGERGDLYVTLVRDGNVWKAQDFLRERPSSGDFITCSDRDFQLDCGIDSYFLPQDKAKELETSVQDGTAIATVRIDGRGNAALIDVSSP